MNIPTNNWRAHEGYIKNAFCALNWIYSYTKCFFVSLFFVFVLCLVCPMLPVSLDCLRPVSCVPNVASLRPVSCVPYVASFSGLSILECALGVL
jgi:hypothetical protein